MDFNQIEIIKKDNDIIQLRVQNEDSSSSYIIDLNDIEKSWVDNIFSMTTSIINNTENNNE